VSVATAPAQPRAGALLRRPAVVAALAVLAVCVPSAEQNASSSVSVTAADVGGVVLVVVALLTLRRRGWPDAGGVWWAFAGLAVVFAIATLTSQDPLASLSGFVRYVEVFVVIPVAVVVVLRDRVDAALMGGAVLLAGVIEGGVGVWQYLTGTGASFGGRDVRAVGTFGALEIMGMATVVGYAIVIAVGLALVLRGTARVALFGLAGGLAVPLLLSLSRGALIATVAAVAVMVTAVAAVTGGRYVVRVLVFGTAAVVVVTAFAPAAATEVGARLATIGTSTSTPDRSVQDRYDLWQTALSIWADHPVNGVGLKQFAAFRDSRAPLSLSSGSDVADASLSFRREPLLSPHNMYLLVLSEQGVIGLLAFAGLLLGLMVRLARAISRRSDRTAWRVAALGALTWTAANFAFGDIGGPTTVLLSLMLGLVAWAVQDGAPA
jgi:O-antigen ligase